MDRKFVEKTLKEFETRVKELSESHRVSDNLKADGIRECISKLQQVLNVDSDLKDCIRLMSVTIKDVKEILDTLVESINRLYVK